MQSFVVIQSTIEKSRILFIKRNEVPTPHNDEKSPNNWSLIIVHIHCTCRQPIYILTCTSKLFSNFIIFTDYHPIPKSTNSCFEVSQFNLMAGHANNNFKRNQWSRLRFYSKTQQYLFLLTMFNNGPTALEVRQMFPVRINKIILVRIK